MGCGINYYERHLGDYARDTGHLSLLEHGVYGVLLDAYYSREKPLPADLKECCRLARAQSKAEREAVSCILREFFQLTDEGYRQRKADEVIARFRDKSEKARNSALASVEARRAASAERPLSERDRDLANKQKRSQRLAAGKEKGRHTAGEWLALVEFCGHKCAKCGVEGMSLDKDHITPLYQGGSDGIDNLQPLCARCNASKGPEGKDYRPDRWREFVCERSANAQQTLSERHALQSPDTKHQSPEEGSLRSPSARALSTEFESFMLATYPEGKPDADFGKAIHFAIGLVGSGKLTEEALRLRVTGYRAYVDSQGVSGQQYVIKPQNWFNPSNPEKPWDKDWRAMPTKAQRAQDSNISASREWLRQQEARDAAN